MKQPSYKLWTYASFALLAGIGASLALLSDDSRLLSALVLPPLVAGLTTTPRRTALVTALTIATGVAVGIDSAAFFATSHLLRLAVIIVVSLLAVQTAILRERDLRTRRRLNLINAARNQLDAASGMEDSLAGFCRAAVAADFAEWAVIDFRVPGAEPVRVVEHTERAGELAFTVRSGPTAASTAYEVEAQRAGALLIHDAPAALLDGLFEGDFSARRHTNVIVKPVSAGDLRAVFYLICPRPTPPWGEAELTQVDALARAAAQRARSDQLIDRLTHAQQELRSSRDEVEAIVGGIASGILAQRPDGEIVYANDVAAKLLGFADAEAMIGENFSTVLDGMIMRHDDGTPLDPDDVPSRRAIRGEERPTELVRYVLKSSGDEYWIFVRSKAVFDADDEPALAIAVIEDNTDRRRAELAQHFLADASKQLSESLDYDSALYALAHASVPSMADWCTIEMLGPGGAIETVAVAHADPARESAVRDFREAFPLDPSMQWGPPLSIATGEGQLYSEVDRARTLEIYGDDAARTAAALPLESRSSLTAPIVVRGRAIGSIMLAATRPGMRFTQYDLDTAIELGRRAGITLDNARLHTERMRMLASLQKSLIPAALPELANLGLSAAFRPAERDAEVGGDFYDAFELADGTSALVIGDVCGKGPEAAALTALARYTIRAAAMTETDPQAILRQLNEALIEQVTDGRFCTVVFARIGKSDAGGIDIEVVSAGHPLPVVIGEGAPRPLGEPGTLLGVVPEPDLPIVREHLPHGSALMLYTDGLSAGQTTDDTGYAVNLVDHVTVNGTADIAAQVNRLAMEAQSEPNRDDVAILVAQFD